MKILAKFRGKTDLQEMDLFDTDRNPLVWPTDSSSSGGGNPIPFMLWPEIDSTSGGYTNESQPVWTPGSPAGVASAYPLPDFMSIDQYGEISTTQRCLMDAIFFVNGLPTSAYSPLLSASGGSFGTPNVQIAENGLPNDIPIQRHTPMKVLIDVGSFVSFSISDMTFDPASWGDDSIQLYGVIWPLAAA